MIVRQVSAPRTTSAPPPAAAPERSLTGLGSPGSPPRPLNVLMVTDHLGHANGVIHGASRYYLQVLPRIDPSRFRITLCILGPQHPFSRELSRAGIHPIFLNRSKWDARALRDISRLIQEREIDLLHCLAMKGCLLGRVAARLSRRPALIHLHDTNNPGAVIGFLQRRIARWTARALAVSDVVARYTHEQLGIAPGRIQTLHNGLDLTAFDAPAPGAAERLRNELGFADDDFVLLLAGRVVQTKGQRLLITLMPRLLAHRPNLRLLIVGDGPDLFPCRELARDLGIEKQVRFTGQRRDMPEVVAASDAAVMPSLVEEGFGFAALEAAAGGRPVVAFAGGAIGEIVDDARTGFVVPRGNVDVLADALLRLTRDRDTARAMGRAGARHASRFGIERHIEQLQRVYAEVSGCGPAILGAEEERP